MTGLRLKPRGRLRTTIQNVGHSGNTSSCNLMMLVLILVAILDVLVVVCAPIKLVVDFPSFGATLLGSLGQDHHHELSPLSLTNADETLLATNQAASSSSYLTSQSDDDPDDLDTRSYSQSNRHSLDDDSDAQVEIEQQSSNNGTIVSTDSDETTTLIYANLTEKLQNSTSAINTDSNNTNIISLTSLSGSNKKSHIIRLPNGQSFQFCDELIDLKCIDDNAVCKMGACVCKPGFFLHRQSGLCQSISDLLKNCENDYQCQAFDVDLICDSKSHDRSFCDCAEGLYFDQESYGCIPCHRNTLVLTTSNKELFKKLNQSTSGSNVASNSSSTVDSSLDLNSTIETTTSSTATTSSRVTSLRPCKPIDIAKLNYRRRKQQHQVPYSSLYDQSARGSSLSSVSSSTSTSTSYHPGSSDPFRIRTPLEVFMGAIMLFTLLTVAWFFLQRMIHDCRVILRSLRNPDFTANCTDHTANGTAGHLTNIVPNSRPGSQLYLDPAGQAVARLLSNDGYNSSLASIYQRDLAGVMVQHLAANLSPSTTSQAIANGAYPRGENEISLYPLTIGSHQSRSAAAAAAAQLLLSPNHPAIAILRAAAASANQNPNSDYTQTSLLNSMLDPPPKYEEAIAQSEQVNQTSSYLNNEQQHDDSMNGNGLEDQTTTRDEDINRDGRSEEFSQRPLSVEVSNGDDGPPESNDLLAISGNQDCEVNNQISINQNKDATNSQSNSSSPTSWADQTGSRRSNSTRRKLTRRSRRGRDSSTRNRHQQQQLNQDSDDTLTETQ